MENTTNEVMVNDQPDEIVTNEVVVNETKDYRIVRLPNGKFRKDMKYQDFHSRVAKTEEEEIELYKVFNDSDNELVIPLKNMIGKQISIAHFFTKAYESFDEETGNVSNGVTTTIQDSDGSYYATSSKSVYYTLFNMMEAFGFPGSENYKPMLVTVTGTKKQKGIQIDLALVGRA